MNPSLVKQRYIELKSLDAEIRELEKNWRQNLDNVPKINELKRQRYALLEKIVDSVKSSSSEIESLWKECRELIFDSTYPGNATRYADGGFQLKKSVLIGRLSSKGYINAEGNKSGLWDIISLIRSLIRTLLTNNSADGDAISFLPNKIEGKCSVFGYLEVRVISGKWKLGSKGISRLQFNVDKEGNVNARVEEYSDNPSPTRMVIDPFDGDSESRVLYQRTRKELIEAIYSFGKIERPN